MTTTEYHPAEHATGNVVPFRPTPIDQLRGDRETRVLDTSEPVLPEWLRNRAAFLGVLSIWTQRNAYRLRRWSWNLPVLLVLLVLYSPRGIWRVCWRLAVFMYDRDSATLRHDFADRRESKEYSAAHRARKENLHARFLVVATVGLPVIVPALAWTHPKVLSAIAGVLICISVIKIIPGRKLPEVFWGAAIGLLTYLFLPMLLAKIPRPPSWGVVAVLAVAVLALGWQGRPKARPLVKPTDFVGAGIPQKPTREMIVEALCRIGVPTLTMQQLERVAQEVRMLGMGVATSAHGYVVELELPPGVTAEMVVAKRSALAGALRRDLGCVWPSGNDNKHPGYLRIFLSHKPMNSGRQPAWPIASGKVVNIFDALPMFTDEEMRWVSLNIAATPHVAVGGASGFGKSVTLRQLALAAAFDPRVRLVVFDGKRSGDLSCIQKLAHAYYEGSEPEDAEAQLRVLRDLLTERDRRSKFLSSLPADERSAKVTDALATKYKTLAPIVLIVDEAQEYTEYGVKSNKTDKAIRDEFVELFTKISRLGRAAGIYMVLCTQKPDANVIPTAIMGNCSVRIAHKVSDQTHNDQILGTSARKNGIDSTMFGARDQGMAWLKGGDAVDAQVVRSWSKMADDLGLAGELGDKAYAIREKRGMLTGMAAGEPSEDDEVAVDVVSDALGIVDAPGHGGRNISLRMLAGRLAVLRPTTWGELDVETLGGLLRGKRVEVGSIWCPSEGRSMQGTTREALLRGDDTDGTPNLSVVH